jgi:serine/threonine protein kinase
MARFRSLLSKGIDIDPKVMRMIRKRGHLSARVPLVQDSEDADDLYREAATTLGTSTKAVIIAAHLTSNIHINSEFTVSQWTEAHFYRAWASGVPCILKFPHQSAVAEHEFQVYQSIIDERKRHLVKVELLTFDNMPVRHANQRSALKMTQYVSTLSSCARGPTLTDTFNTAANAVFHGLEAIHSAGLCHLDVKPGNIFVDSAGACFLGDYDAVAHQGAEVRRTTEAFLPREFAVLRSRHLLIATPAVDFSMLACTLIHLLDASAPASPSLSDIQDRTSSMSETTGVQIRRIVMDCVGRANADTVQIEKARKVCEEMQQRQVQGSANLAAGTSGTESLDIEPLL